MSKTKYIINLGQQDLVKEIWAKVNVLTWLLNTEESYNYKENHLADKTEHSLQLT